MSFYEATYGKVESRPAFKTEYWWTGDEDMDWTKEFDDTGVDGIFGTNDEGENDSKPTMGEPNFDKTDIDESDQIGLTGFKMNRIAAGQGASSTEVDGIVFYNNGVKIGQKLCMKCGLIQLRVIDILHHLYKIIILDFLYFWSI